MAEDNQDMRACQTTKRVGPEYQGAASARSGKSWTIAGCVGSDHAYLAGGPMYALAAQADRRRGESRSTRTKGQRQASTGLHQRHTWISGDHSYDM